MQVFNFFFGWNFYPDEKQRTDFGEFVPMLLVGSIKILAANTLENAVGSAILSLF